MHEQTYISIHVLYGILEVTITELTNVDTVILVLKAFPVDNNSQSFPVSVSLHGSPLFYYHSFTLGLFYYGQSYRVGFLYLNFASTTVKLLP